MRSRRCAVACWLAGTALLIRRQALDSIGGRLDSDYWMYWEDTDTSSKLLAGGWRVEEFTSAHVRHHGGASGGGPDARRRVDLFAHFAWGEHCWFWKNRPRWESAAVWLLDLGDVFRRFARGLVRSGRRQELAYAGMLAKVLCFRLLGKRPAVPG